MHGFPVVVQVNDTAPVFRCTILVLLDFEQTVVDSYPPERMAFT